jgi:hypothetical protein
MHLLAHGLRSEVSSTSEEAIMLMMQTSKCFPHSFRPRKRMPSLSVAAAVTVMLSLGASAWPSHAQDLAAPLANPVWLCNPVQTVNGVRSSNPNNLCHQDMYGNRTDQTPSSTYPQAGVTVPLNATVVNADGSTTTQPLSVTSNPSVDCFYVYPTVDFFPNPTPQVGSIPPTPQDQEMATLLSQVGRLQGICRLFAPLYRQDPLLTLVLSQVLTGLETYSGPGFGDVQQAFMEYWNNENYDPRTGQHRPFILLGHSQGANAVEALIQADIDGSNPANAAVRQYMVSAVILGGLVQVPFGNPYGNDANSTFSTIPLCQQSSSTGCVIAYSSYATAPQYPTPPLGGNLAMNLKAGEQTACVDPTALLQNGNGYFDSYLGTQTLFNGNAINTYGSLWLVTLIQSAPGAANYPTGFANYNSSSWLNDGGCTQTGTSTQNETWLQINNASSIYNASALSNLENAAGVGFNLGLHMADFNIDEGALFTLLPQQLAAWQTQHP